MRQISNKVLDAHKESFKGNQGYLLPPMRRYVVRKVTEDAAESNRRTDIMHPSEMCKPGWCQRKDYYRITLGVREELAAQFSSELIFAEGHTIHDKYQRWLSAMGLLYGRWVCKADGHSFFGQSPRTCPACGSDNLRYKEVPLENKDYMIAGHADGAVNTGNEWLEVDEPFLIEVKSIGLGTIRVENPELYRKYTDNEYDLTRLWQEIKRPFSAHIRQATLYCWLSGYKKMVFIYESKWNQQTKEFVVTPDFKHIQWILDGAKDVAQSIRQGIEPYRPGWAKKEHKTCKACPYKGECWGETDDKTDQPKPVAVRKAPVARRRKALRPS
jgi:rubrerythrin